MLVLVVVAYIDPFYISVLFICVVSVNRPPTDNALLTSPKPDPIYFPIFNADVVD